MGKEIGIDLGTTNTVVSYIDKKNKLKTLKNKGKTIIPSAIFFNSEDEWEIGDIALNKMKLNPKAGIRNFKSTIGSRDKFKITAENGDKIKLSSKDVASYFLNSVVKMIENRLIKEFGPEDGVIENAIITVPAKFSSTEKEATKYSAIDAGLRNVKLLAEPTAAAVGYQRESQENGKTILVYDFGGGTFDVSVLRENNGVFNEIATGGDKHLGGNTLTNNIVKFLLETLEDDYNLIMPELDEEIDEDDFEDEFDISFDAYKKNMQAIVDAADELKENISSSSEEELMIDIILADDKPIIFEVKFTREEVEDILKEDIEKTVKITREVIEEVVENENIKIDEIILAGGSSQIPLVKDILESNIDLPIKYADDVSSIISRGAAILANLNYSDGLMKAITNVELGIEIIEGTKFRVFEPLIEVNKNLPYKIEKEYSLKEDNQERLKIKIYERDIKNYPNATRVYDDGIEEIDELIISNLPKGLCKNDIYVKVVFDAKIDGSLNVSAELIDRYSARPIKDRDTIEVNKASNLE